MSEAGPSGAPLGASPVYCGRCGARNDQLSEVFCRSCGTVLDAASLLDRTAAMQAIPGTAPDDPDHHHIDRDTVAQLVVTRGPNLGARYRVPGEVTIGRSPTSTVLLDDISVSRRHATVTSTARGLAVEDAGSLNGTYVNGRRIETRTTLEHGDQLQVGRYKLTIITP